MSKDVAIHVSHISKAFLLPHERAGSIKNALIGFARRKRGYEKHTVLEDVSLEVKKGEFFGVVGRNGSGKSTLLKLLAGIYAPDKGNISIGGKLTPFIELGVGFNPELSGRDNVFLNGALLGFNRKEMLAMYDDIVAFAELEEFMDQKLKNYSSGMQVRLAFSIAIKVNSDILLLDEVLAVGDASFQKKCFEYFRSLKKSKKTVIFISHDMNAVREYCDRAVLIEKGKIVSAGSADSIAKQYVKLFMRDSASAMKDGNRWGTGKVVAKNIDAKIKQDEVKLDVTYRFNDDISNPVFGLSIINPVGVRVFESNTKWKHIRTGTYKQGEEVCLSWEIPNIFTNGTNYVTVAVASEDTTEFYDWWDEAGVFTIDKDEITTAVTLTAHNVGIRKIHAH